MSIKPIEHFGEAVTQSLTSRLPDLTHASQLELSEADKERLIFSPLEELAKKTEAIFGTSDEALQSPDFPEILAEGFLQILTSIVREAEKLPPNLIAECHMNEVVFTHASDPKPIAATDSLATCVGIAGYEKKSKSGFVTHISTEVEFETSKAMLTEKILQIATEEKNPIEIHLRGGIKNSSEPLVDAIEEWVNSLSERGYPIKILTKEVLQEGFMSPSGIPNSMSISLDTRDGTLSTYDSSQNPHAKPKMELSAEKVDEMLTQAFVDLALKTSKIAVAYCSLPEKK